MSRLWIAILLNLSISLQTTYARSLGSLCDYYTTALLVNNTDLNQITLMTLLVNTIIAGNYTKPNLPGITFPDVSVPGILANSTVDGTIVTLSPYFDGALYSANRNGQAVAINFLDDGGTSALTNNKPSNGASSNQYFLVTHLYQFFGIIFGCSQQGSDGFPFYGGIASQYEVHRFMALDNTQVFYFITQVGLAIASFGFSAEDVTTVVTFLGNVFNQRCSPNVTIIPESRSLLQSICIDSDCPVAPNPVCSSYPAVVVPGIANTALADGLGNSSNTISAKATSTSAATTNVPSSSSGSPSASSPAEPSSPSGLSDGAKIGIGVGVGLGGLIILIAIFLLGRRVGARRHVREEEKPSRRHEPGTAIEHSEPGVAVEPQKY